MYRILQSIDIKKLFVVLSLFLLFLVISIGFTYAYYSIRIPKNTSIKVSSFDTEINTIYRSKSNIGTGVDDYNFKVENKSDNPFYVRVSFKEELLNGGRIINNDLNGIPYIEILFDNPQDWIKIGDYYYYKMVVDSDGETSRIIKGFKYNEFGNLNYKVLIKVEIVSSTTYESVWNISSNDLNQDTTYKVVYNKNASDAVGNMDDDSFTYGTSGNLSRNLFTRGDYVFGGWMRNDYLNDVYMDEGEVISIGSRDKEVINLYAIWLNKYNVNFDSNDNINCPLDSSIYEDIDDIIYGELISEYATSNPLCLGYTFTGWTSLNINLDTAKYGNVSTPNNPWTEYNKGTYFKDLSTTMNGTVTLFANFEPSIYTLTLDNQNGTSNITAIYLKYDDGFYSDSNGTTRITNISVPFKTGVVFDGYYTLQNGDGVKVIDSSGNILVTNNYFVEDKTLFANWVLVWAENLEFDNTETELDCSDVQCSLDTIYNIIN